MRSRLVLSTLLAVAQAIVVSLVPLDAFAVTLPVTINTASLSGRSGTLAFDFIDGGDGPNNSLSISNLGPPTPVTLTDATGFDEFLHPIIFGSSLNFTLDLTTNFDSSKSLVPDALSLFFLGSSAISSIVTSTDPTGADAIMRVDLVGGTPAANVFFFEFTPTGISTPIPEPNTLFLVVAALPFLAWMRFRRYSTLKMLKESRSDLCLVSGFP
jgi:hypothetical protein